MSERSVTVRLRCLISDYQKAMQTAAGDSKKFASVVKGNFTQLNNDVGKLGETMTRRVTLPLVGVGVGAVKLASDFETTFGQMVGLAGVAAGEVDGLREAVLKLSKDTARGPNELAQALYFIRSSGIDAAHAMGVLEVAAKASAAGLGSTVVVADAVTSAMNAYGAANLSAQQATDILVAAVREGKTEAAALAPQLGILIPTAAAMGISFAQVAGVMAVMSRTGLDAAEASTSLNAIFSTLLGTSKEGVAALEEHGLSLKSLRDTAAGPGGLVAVMRILDTTFSDNDEALSQVIPNVRAFRGVMNVLAQDGASVDRVMKNVADSAGATDDAFKAVKDTWAFKLKQAVVELQIALVKLGEVIGPVLSALAASAAYLAEGFSHLPHWVQEVVISLGLLLVAAGPAMKIFSTLAGPAVSAIKLIIGQLVALRTTIIANQVAGMSYGRALATSLVPVGTMLTAVAVAAAGAAIIWNDYNQKKQRASALSQQLTIDLGNEADAANKLSAVSIGKDIVSGDLGNKLRGAKVDISALIDAVRTGSPVMTQAMKDTQVSIDEVLKNLNKAAIAGDPLARALLTIQGQAALTSTDFIRLIKLLDSQADSYAGASDAAKNAAFATGQVGDATKVSGEAAGTASGQLSTYAAAAAAIATDATIAENAVRRLLAALDATYGSAFAVSDAQQAYADSLIDVDTAAKASGGSSRNLEKDQRALAKATDDVTKAQKGLADAEAALAEARKGPSAREKSDAGLNVREAQLGVKEAIKAQADARKRLLEERKKGREGDVAGAQLDLERSAISLKRAQDRLTDAQAEQNKVMHSGEETSDDVKSALDDLQGAQERVTDATTAQSDTEAQLRGEAGGGPVADRARNIARTYDALVTASKDVIDALIAQKAPTEDIIAVLDTQTTSAKNLIAAYGDPDGKLAKFIELNERLRLIFTDEKFLTNFSKVAGAIGGAYGVPIPNFFGSDSTGPVGGRAHGGPVGAGATVRVNEQGDEYLSMGNKPGYVKTAAQMSSLYSSPMMSASSVPTTTVVRDERPIDLRVELDGVALVKSLIRQNKLMGSLPITIRGTH